MSNIATGWYPDPDGSGALRYWDGNDWTEDLRAAPESVGPPPSQETRSPQRGPPPEPEGDLTQVRSPLLVPAAGPHADEGDKQRNPWTWVIAVLGVAVVGVWAFVAFQLLSGDDDSVEGNVAAENRVGTPGRSSEDDDQGAVAEATPVAIPTRTPTPVPSPTTTPTPTPTATPEPAQRTATLLVNIARLREAPRLSASVVDTIEDLENSPITVLGEPVNGWYEVEIQRKRGWMFGGFIVPSADNLTVVITRNEEPVELLDRRGLPLGVENESGSYALVVDATGEFWPIILPDGGTAYIDPSTIRVIS